MASQELGGFDLDGASGEAREGLDAAERWERAMWRSAFGEEWVRGLETLAERAAEAGVTIEAGSGELAATCFASRVGWAPGPRDMGAASAGVFGETRSLRGAWVLRTAPGLRDRLAKWIEEIPGLAPEGAHPAIQIEESAIVWLPRVFCAASLRWPERESWIRASLLVDGAHSFRRRITADSFDSLAAALETLPAISGRERLSIGAPEARLRAFDRLRAALAWEQDRDAYERVRGAAARPVRSGDTMPAATPRNGSRRSLSSLPGGGTFPFLPHTVFAHDSRPAASPWTHLSRFFREKCA